MRAWPYCSASIAALMLVVAAQSAAACEDYDAAVAAVEAKDLPTAVGLYDRVSVDPACGDDFRNWLGEAIARAYVQPVMAPGVAPAEKRAALETAVHYHRNWWLYAEIGRTAFEQRDFAASARALQTAIDRLDTDPQADTVSQSDVEALVQLAASAVALADEPVAPTTSERGAPGGLFAGNVRGFVVEEVALPITFQFDSVRFDAKGAYYAERLLETLMYEVPAVVTIAGHTDRTGNASYNMELSRRRAMAVRDYLLRSGFPGQIQIEWYGENKPPHSPPGIVLSQAEYDRLARRVELRR
ncbi:MAG: OmpA family protein [Pseudomonadota bacterium]